MIFQILNINQQKEVITVFRAENLNVWLSIIDLKYSLSTFKS